MTVQYNRFPTYQEALTKGKNTASGWYVFWAGLFTGQPKGPVAAISVGASPFTYQSPQGGTVYLSGGTTTQVQISRDGSNFYITGATSGPFPLSQGDLLVVSYSVSPPTATFVPT